MGFLGGSDGKESTCNAGDMGSTTGLGRSPGEGNNYRLQCSGLEISMGCIIQGVAKRRLFATSWTIAHQTPLSMGILQTRILEWVAMPSSRAQLI